MKKQKGLKSDRVVGVFDFNPLLAKISTVINKHFRSMINENPELREVFPNPLMAALYSQSGEKSAKNVSVIFSSN